jgi:two-component system phosphate regulon sensor histidine kinase PhoR
MKRNISIWHKVKFILFLIVLNLYILICWSIAYFITPHLYRWFGMAPHPFNNQLIISFVGFFIFGCTLFTIGTLNAPRRMAGIKVILDGIRRIAKGDFAVQLPIHDRGHPFGEIVHSINDMAVELNQMEQMRQGFISNVSHEIQSPLTSISGFARVLHNEQLSQEERMHYLGIIEAESMRLAKLSENLLKLTSLESEHHPFEPVKYRLDKQLRSLVLACEPLWLAKNIDIDIVMEEITIFADQDLLSQVWVNLLNNSIKFTPQDGTIQIKLHKHTDQAIIEISDTGIGIADADQAHIFERFYKADKSRNQATVGSGLGLAIVKKIIDMHKGTILVVSKVDVGTTQTIQLPLG